MSVKNRNVLLLAILLICMMAAGSLEFAGRFAAASRAEPVRQTETRPDIASAHGNQNEPGATAEIQVIKITPFGFEPRELERSHRAFVLAVHNFSDKADLSLRLLSVQGNKLHEVRMGRGKRKWQLPLTLPPGDYLLSEASQPDWRCQIRLIN